MKNTLKKSLVLLAASTLLINSPIALAGTWNGVDGVSDTVIANITKYENLAAGLDGQIETLNWQIQQNEGSCQNALNMMEQIKNAKPGDALYDPDGTYYAEWQQAYNNNYQPMQVRKKEREKLQNQKQNHLNLAEQNRQEANRQAEAIKNQNNNNNNNNGGSGNSGGNNGNSGGNGGGNTVAPVQPVEPSEPEVTEPSEPEVTEPSEPEITEPEVTEPEITQPETPDEDKEEEKEPEITQPETPDEDKEEEKEPEVEIPNPGDTEENQNIVDENDDEIKEDLDDFDHDKTVEELLTQNDDGSISVSEDAMKKAILDKINEYRVAAGLDPVESSESLVNYATSKGDDYANAVEAGRPSSGHSNSQLSQGYYDEAMDSNDDFEYILDDLAGFSFDFTAKNYDSMDDALDYLDKLAEMIVGPMGGFLSDDHALDILNPLAAYASVGLVSREETYIDAWTGEEKTTTVWYLAYVYAASSDKREELENK
ncbi:hypothetical protein [Vagococcus xieshaowenii]|uniref:Uncharacterized protein n=1 Tax=Vagococcus xieshaowenii TaxID=2562451 RepID=A0A4Z0DCC9_9ENTE|nr:hypothetical protein [Vagococcus xieshaowenii]QCA29478.1 hypothetical protein E4Z98_09160 [Vagococcus xieshaowenii]TFZ42594.1 hypothetical protein E4031_02560 [Vagococcus xieshaowenii]